MHVCSYFQMQMATRMQKHHGREIRHRAVSTTLICKPHHSHTQPDAMQEHHTVRGMLRAESSAQENRHRINRARCAHDLRLSLNHQMSTRFKVVDSTTTLDPKVNLGSKIQASNRGEGCVGIFGVGAML